MLRWRIVGTLAMLGLAPATAAAAPVRLSDLNARVQALAVADGRALAIVDSLDRAQPFELVSGAGNSIGIFGIAAGEFPDLAVDSAGRVAAAWSRVISGGAAIEAVAVDPAAEEPFEEPALLAQSTGPPRLAMANQGLLLAFPDRDGNLALLANPLPGAGEAAPAGPAQAYALTSTAPHRRHLPFELAVGAAGPLVLDLVQTRRLTELRVIGPGAPDAPVTSVPGVRNLPSALAADKERTAVAYLSRGRAVLATPGADGTWRRRVLPGPGGGTDPPAVAIAGDSVYIAYEQLVPRARRRPLQQLYLAVVRGTSVRARRLTDAHADDGRPLAAADGGGAYVAWTRVTLGTGFRTPYIVRVD